MATKMLNFGGTITATTVGDNNGSCVIPISGRPDDMFTLRSSREEGSVVIIFSMVLNNQLTDENVTVDLWVVNEKKFGAPVSVGKSITLVPGRPVSLDYKVNLTETDGLYVVADKRNGAAIVISAVQM